MIKRMYSRTPLLLMLVIFAACTTQDAQPANEEPPTVNGLQIGFASEADPPRSGDNTFEVTVRKDGAPVDDANVTTVFSMPAMPSMNMPAMQSTATLQPEGGGRYKGNGQLSMAGTWNVRVTVSKNGEELGTRDLSIIAK
jgi:hypothetical protein